MLGFLLSTLACEPMANPGNPFSDEPALSAVEPNVVVSEVIERVEAPNLEEPSKSDGVFADPQDTKPIYSSAEPDAVASNEAKALVAEENTEVVAPAEGAETEESKAELADVESVVPETTESAISTGLEASDRLRPARIQDGWSPTLVSTISSIPIPKAVITLPSGKDIVVQPGDILREEGVVVMSIGQDIIELAIISNAGGSAAIQNLTLHSRIKQAARGEH